VLETFGEEAGPETGGSEGGPKVEKLLGATDSNWVFK